MASISDALEELLSAEQSARAAAERARNEQIKDQYIMTAERLADRAWSMAERTRGCPPLPSDVWARQRFM